MLYDRLIAPVVDLLPGQRRLYLAPHGPLHYVPFQALIGPDAGSLLSADGPQIIYTPSATFLFHRDASPRVSAPLPCLALGYNGDQGSRMRFAEEEARSIAALTGGDVLSGPQPKKAALAEIAGRYRVLHISCHGTFDPLSPLDSALYLATGEQLTALNVLQHLRLSCDLVVLSACESGLSRVQRGDELIGLARAFFSAGARAVICTLWRVDERSTRLLFGHFYRELRSGTGVAEALKRAQLQLRALSPAANKEALLDIIFSELVTQPQAAASLSAARKSGSPADSDPLAADAAISFAEPFYWAPFILIGSHNSV
jgi:CHAT domain-containing protein